MTDKLETFLNDIDAAAEREIAAIEHDADERETALKTAAQQKAASDAAQYLQRELGRIGRDAELHIAARRAEEKRELLALRESYAEEVFQAVRVKIADYTGSEAYPKRLAELLEQGLRALGEGEAVLWLRREDMALGETLLSKCPGAALKEGDFALGGLQISVGNRRADLSFDTALEAQRSRFAELSGMEIEL